MQQKHTCLVKTVKLCAALVMHELRPRQIELTAT